MTHYASKELIDRVNVWLLAALDDALTESTFGLLSDIAKAEPLPAPPRASIALLDAAKTVWMTSPAFAKTGPECDHLSAVNDLYVAVKAEEARGPSEVEQLRKQRDDAVAELAACFGYLPLVPGPALAWDGIHLEPHVVRVADEYSIMRERAEEAEQDPRPSSALLEAAKALIERHKGDCGGRLHRDDHEGLALAKAIEAEEARGPSEVETLRKERDEDLEPLSVDVGGEVIVLERHEAVEKIRELAARAEKAESERDEARAAGSKAVMLKLKAWICKDIAICKMGTAEWVPHRLSAMRAVLTEIDSLLVSHPSDVASVDSKLPCGDKCATPIDCASGLYHKPNTCVKGFDDGPLAVWDKYQRGYADPKPAYVQAINELFRLARREGGK